MGSIGGLPHIDEINGLLRNVNPNSPTSIKKASNPWTQSFYKALESGYFDLAFCSIMGNPDKIIREVQISQFVEILVRKKSIQKLSILNLPVAEVYRYLKTSLNAQAEKLIADKNQDSFWQMYAFYVNQTDYASASYILHLYAQKIAMSKSLKSLLEEQERALAAAMATLSLLPSDSCFLPPRKHDIIKFSKSNFEFFPSKQLIFTSSPSPSPSPLLPKENLNEHNNNQSVNWCTKQDLEKDYYFVLSRNKLFSHYEANNQMNVDLNVDEIIEKLSKFNEFSFSLSLAYCFYKGTELNKRLEVIFKIMTKNFCSIQMEFLNPAEKRTQTPETISKNPYLKENIELQMYLEKHAESYPSLCSTVARCILNYDVRFQLPLWLINLFHGIVGSEKKWNANLSSLILIYLDFQLVPEALEVAISILRSSNIYQIPTGTVANQLHSIWTPYSAIDRLKTQAQVFLQSQQNEKDDSRESPQVERVKSLLTELDLTLKKHLNKVKLDSSQFSYFISRQNL